MTNCIAIFSCPPWVCHFLIEEYFSSCYGDFRPWCFFQGFIRAKRRCGACHLLESFIKYLCFMLGVTPDCSSVQHICFLSLFIALICSAKLTMANVLAVHTWEEIWGFKPVPFSSLTLTLLLWDWCYCLLLRLSIHLLQVRKQKSWSHFGCR